MIDFITKKTVPDQKLPFVKKGKKKPRSKSGRQRGGVPSKRFHAEDTHQKGGGGDSKINRIAGVIGGMASQVAEGM